MRKAPTHKAWLIEIRLEELLHRAMGLVNRRIGVGTPRCVGVRNRDAPESLAGNDPWLVLLGRPVRVGHRVALIRVAVRPAIDGDPFDVTGRIEPSPQERSS